MIFLMKQCMWLHRLNAVFLRLRDTVHLHAYPLLELLQCCARGLAYPI
jgi:hypothetical protein